MKANTLQGPALLAQNMGIIRSRMGAFFPVEQRVVFRGKDLFSDLKDLDWMALYLFGITGRRYTPQQMRVLHVMWTHTSYPDVRLWNNRVAALAGTARSTGVLGISAALAVSEASIYGGASQLRSSEFLVRAKKQVDAGADLETLVRAELKEKRGIGGYGRPMIASDERIAPVMAIVREQGLENGAYLKLAFAVHDILKNGRWRWQMNFVGLTAALSVDFGMSPQEYYLGAMPVFLAGMPLGYIEAVEKRVGTLMPLPCTVLAYHGVVRRRWRE